MQEVVKVQWYQLKPKVPAGWDFALRYEACYGCSELDGKLYESVRSEYFVFLSSRFVPFSLSPVGKGRTAEEALRNALSDLDSRFPKSRTENC